ncbi:MAG: hypothetical protein K2X29_03480 [Candidatus Obscuribacterales bacterium]|nr:hypothetical protein [Candidatus Obscuribacterales bacterium]
MSEVAHTENPKEHLEKILSILEIQAKVSEKPVDESTTCYHIDCQDTDAKLLIGRKGQALEALQFLLRQMCRTGLGEEAHILVDVMDYRTRREQSIIDRAKRGAVAVCNGEYEEYELQPMSAFERRLVHNYLQEHFPDLASQSRGMGPNRHIVISYSGLPQDRPAGESGSEPLADEDDFQSIE